MAKRASKRLPSLTREMRRHVERFGGKPAYLRWCDMNMFACSFDKTPEQMAAETASLTKERERARERAKRQTEIFRNPGKLLEDICFGRLRSEDIDRRDWQSVASIVEFIAKAPESRAALLPFLQHVHSVADLLLETVEIRDFDTPYVLALCRLNERRHQWRRSFETWRPPTHNTWRQFMSLVRHLLADYPVPAFMDWVWFEGDHDGEQHRDWYVHIGSGNNIRTAKTPVPLTKLMAHHMMLAPDDWTVEHAIRWGQVHALGGDRLLAEAVISSRLGRTFANEEFWLSLVRFLIDHPMFDRQQVGPLVDYLRHQKFSRPEEIDEAGRVRVLPPRRPRLSMRGRTPERLMHEIEQWHGVLGRARRMADGTFPPSGIKPLELSAGRAGENTWRISELLTVADLHEEGLALHHCAATYDSSCTSGRCSLWSMRLETISGMERRQTIEVSKRGEIVQTRGKYNRLPTASEFNILKIWAEQAGLRIASYVRPQA